jgi:hemerythrin-like metal-binding protein
MTTYFPWTSAYVTGIAAIDAQHHKMVDRINFLFTAIDKGTGADVLDGILEELLDYTEKHFSMEEALFDKFGYPETAAHKQEHTELRAQVLQLKKDLEGGRDQMTVRVGFFLMEWLKKHILQSDKQYVPFLTSKGVK